MGERETPDRSLRSYLSIPSCVSAVLISLPYRSLSLAHIHLTDTHIPIPPAVNSFPAVGINGLFSPFPAVFTVNGHSLYAVRSFL